MATLKIRMSSVNYAPINTICINPCLLLNKLINFRTFVTKGIPHGENDLATSTEEIRNVSRMSANRYKQYHRQPPELAYKDLIHQKELYAKYGQASGEDARLLWPTRKKLLDKEQEEMEEGKPLLERLAQIEAEKKIEEENRLKRHETIEKNMAQMNKWIAEYRKKHEMAAKADKERLAKKQALLDEAREILGYKVQANDPKFQQMLADREEMNKKEAKKKRKEEKLKKFTAYVAKSSETTPDSTKQEK